MNDRNRTPVVLPEVQRLIERMRQEQLAGACDLARVGVRTVQNRDRTADTARRRAVVAWILRVSFGWRQRQIAADLGLTVRAVKKILRKTKVSSPPG